MDLGQTCVGQRRSVGLFGRMGRMGLGLWERHEESAADWMVAVWWWRGIWHGIGEEEGTS
eukprot:1149862-Pelagomonas_calceolata.AAC.7